MKYLLMHKQTAVLELDIDEIGRIAKLGAVFAPKHLPVGVQRLLHHEETVCITHRYWLKNALG